VTFSKQKFAYSRAIKLAPAIGDWTTIQYKDTNADPIQISAIKNIGFNSLPKEKVRHAHYLHYKLAEKMVQKISSDLDIHVELHTVTASQMSHNDYIHTYQNQVVQCNFNIEKLGKINLAFDWGLADSMINRLTGGSGEESHSETITSIELNILQGEIEQLIPLLTQQWRSLFSKSQMDLDIICGRFVPDKKLPLREAVTVFSMYVYFGKSDLFKIVWAYPSEILRKLLYALSLLPDPIKPSIHLQPKTVKTLKTEVKAVLGKTSLTMKELKTLQPGDIIPLDTSLQSPIDIIIGGKTKLLGQLGTHQNHLAVQLIFLDADSHTPLYSSPISEPSEADLTPFANVQITHTQEPRPQEAQDDTNFLGSSWLTPTAAQPSVSEDKTEEEQLEEDEFEDEDFETFDDEDEVNATDDDQEEYVDEDDFEEDNEEEEDDVRSKPAKQNTPQKASAKTQEDDFSWDSLDDHF
jgi:flagellar motor switch protein FliM